MVDVGLTRSRSLPEEIALAGFDNMPWALSLRPSLTAMAPPVEKLGQMATQMQLDRMSDPHRLVRQVVLPLIVHASCGTHIMRLKISGIEDD
ncbi:MAG: substrate-binding domain-containing protein [Limisphaerales bacterium]